ncbi:MAG: hypothetical protein K8R59_15500 [Thermoanaerobaculales bacterium]|nr:hypothetical protein [Thermoanaerobaculales bacterium]
MIDEGVMTSVRQHPTVASELADLENEVLTGRTTATAAAEIVLSHFGSDLLHRSP